MDSMGLGFNSGLLGLEGYAINEGATANLTANSNSYFNEREITNILALILGSKEVYEAYTNSSLISLKKSMYQYISPKSANELIYLMDLNLFQQYIEDFLVKNKIPYNKDKMVKYYLSRTKRICKTIEEMFKAKYGVEMRNSNIGRLILKTQTFQSTITNFPNHVCDIEVYDDNTVQVFLSNLYSPLFQIRDTEKRIEYYKSKDFRKEMARKMGGEYLSGDIDIYLEADIRQDYSNITVSVDEVSVLLNRDNLPNLDVDKLFRIFEKIQDGVDWLHQGGQEER